MRRFYLGIVAASALLASVPIAQSAEVTICSGRSGGGYDALMKSIGAEIEKKGHTVTLINLAGSEDILNNLAAGKCSFGPAQKDIYYGMNKKDASLSSTVGVTAPLYNEVMTLMCSKSSNYDELEDIQEGDQIIVGEIGSGSALTWENIVAIEKEYGGSDDWSKATPIFEPLDEAAGQLQLGTAKCAFGVGKVPINWALAIEELGGYVGWIYDKDINDLEFNGASLYEAVRVPYGAYTSKFDTYVVPAILFKSNKLKADPEIESLIKRVAPSLGNKVNTVK